MTKPTAEVLSGCLFVFAMCAVSGLVCFRIGVDTTKAKYDKIICDMEESQQEACNQYIEMTHELVEEIEELKGLENPIDYEDYE